MSTIKKENNDGSQSEESTRPKLYNPNTAANWSLLFSPAFGAYLHALNWRELGKHKKAQDNVFWVWATLLLFLVSIFIPDSKANVQALRSISIWMLLIWYFVQARPQVKYVKEVLGNDYIKRGMGKPVLIALGAVFIYMAIVFIIAMMMSK